MALVVTNGGVSMTTIEGFSANSSSAQTMALSWFANMPGVKFGTGTFSDTAYNYSTMGVYTSTVTTSYVCGSGLEALAQGSGVTIANHLKLVITSVDSTHVKGTFSGDFYFQDDITGAKKTITAGDFDVPWKK